MAHLQPSLSPLTPQGERFTSARETKRVAKPRVKREASASTPATPSPLFSSIRSRLGKANIEGAFAIIVLLALWQYASSQSTPMFFPSLQSIATTAGEVLLSAESLTSIGTTYLRIIAFLGISFVAASALGIAAAVWRPFERFVVPLIELKQGVPAVCWIIFAILWFRDMETRIAFVVVVTALPAFFYQSRDAVRSIPRDLVDMVRALRPSIAQTARILIVPSMLPSLLTVWRINIGNATRVTIMAELLGGITGIGYQLRLSQEQFRMDQVIAWTLVLMAFVLISNQVLSFLERRLLKWRNTEGVRYA